MSGNRDVEGRPGHQRIAELHARLEAGEFDAAFSVGAASGPGQLAREYGEEFRLYGYAARVDRDPSVDFDGFLDDLWVMVASRFQLLPGEEAGAELLRGVWDSEGDSGYGDVD